MKPRLIHGDCLEEMDKLIAEGVIVDAIITDPPFGITACKWDTVIPFNNHIMIEKGKKKIVMYETEWVMQELEGTHKSIHQCRAEFQEQSKEGMWQKINKLIKPNGAIVLFGSEPFSSALRMSNIKNYKYDWIWEKNRCVNFLNANKMPMKNTENIVVFYSLLPTYNPQDLVSVNIKKTNSQSKIIRSEKGLTTHNGGRFKPGIFTQRHTNYPKQVLKFNSETNTVHPTQKPVALMEYFIKTYTNEGELVLDFTCGSGSTLVAAKNTNRRAIGIDNELRFVDISRERVEGIKSRPIQDDVPVFLFVGARI